MGSTDANQMQDRPDALTGMPAPPRLEFTPPPADLPPSYAGLGVRGLALAIDALISLVAVIPLAAAQGGVQASNGTFGFQITGLPLVVAAVAWLIYMTLMEGKYGASLGKRIMRLRVVTEGGSPVSLEAALIRNLLRFLDAFPYFLPYLLGAIAASRSPLKQRFGDRIAETVVVARAPDREAKAPAPSGDVAVPGPSVRRRAWRPLVVATLGLALVLAGAYAFVAIRGRCDIGGGTYDCHGVEFTYPSSWSEIDDAEILNSGNLEFGDVVGLDPLNNVELQGYRLSQPVDDSNVDRFEREISQAADELAAAVSGQVTGGPTRVEIGGLPGFRLRVEGSYEGQPLTVTGVVLFRGTTQYFLECQFTPDHARDIRAGCRQVMRTFRAS
ncbi:MAG TPA: RDD family protein [Actinomycetota bacterium]|nr:RDD family protein [Actinomycetota bacterium]